MDTIKKQILCSLLLMAGATQCAMAQDYTYYERSWNGTEVVTTEKVCSNYTSINLTSEDAWLPLNNGWYVVTENSKFKSIVVQGTDVHLLIPDLKTLTLTGGVRLMAGHKLSIHSQGGDIGVLNVTNEYSGAAGIGSATVEGVEQAAGELVIHGGHINATGGKYGAGIGSGAKSIEEDTYLCGTVTVYGGTVTAIGGEDGAGIGGGAGYKERGNHGGTLILYGGTVTAQGGNEAAGVGGGGGYDPSIYSSVWGGKGGRVEVYGGALIATGGSKGAGIGSGEHWSPNSPDAAAVYVYGGTVTAQGGEDGAGIGGGENGGGAYVEVSGGEVHATGGKYGAGIGGGENSRGGTFKITGGTVVAKGAPGAAGIGGGDGDYGLGGKNYILGGTVVAEAGTQGGTGNRAFGPSDNIEWENDQNFYLELGNEMAVCAGNEGANNTQWFTSGERTAACMYRSYARIEPCTHEASTTYTIDIEQHKGNCTWCNLQAGGNHVLVKGLCQECKAIILNDDSSNYSTINNIQDSPVSIISPAVFIKGRTFWRNGAWNTLCLPFDLNDFAGTPLDEATVRPLESATLSNGTLTLNFGEPVTKIVHGNAYIVKWEYHTNIYDPKFENVKLESGINILETPNSNSSQESVITFRGEYAPLNITGEDRTLLYLGNSNMLYYPQKAMTIGAFRAYFKLADGLTIADSNSSAQNAISAFNLNFADGGTTRIAAKDFQDFMDNNTGTWYSIDGRRLMSKPTVKGIYINNGKKVIIR